MKKVKSKIDEKTTYHVGDRSITILRDGESATVNFGTLENFASRLKESIKDELLAIRLEHKGRNCPICNGRFYNKKSNIYCSRECSKEANRRNVKKWNANVKKPKEKSAKANNRKSQLSEINNKAKALGMSYGQYQAMRYKETMR